MSFSENLKTAREKKGLTQRELARLLNVSPSLVTMYETGTRKPSFEMLCALGQCLEVRINDLVAEEGIPNSKEDAEVLRLYKQADPVYQQVALDVLRSHQREP